MMNLVEHTLKTLFYDEEAISLVRRPYTAVLLPKLGGNLIFTQTYGMELSVYPRTRAGGNATVPGETGSFWHPGVVSTESDRGWQIHIQ